MIRCLVLTFLLLAVQLGAGRVAARDLCAAADDVSGSITPLPHVAAALKAGGTLRILAVGSATMFGPDASLVPGTMTSQLLGNTAPAIPSTPTPLNQEASDRAFPRQMARAIQAAVPRLNVQVVVRGGRGMSAADMLGSMQMELAQGRYQLILWQTGTVEAVRNTPPGDFAQTLSAGVEAAEAAEADLVLIDPQYSRFLQANSNLDPYAQAMQQAAAMPGVLLFRRFDLMRSWANDGQIDLERTPRSERKQIVDTLHACLGARLARAVLAGARS